MTHPLKLPALDGREPLGFLAALGLLRLLTEQTQTPVALSFSNTTAEAILHSTYTDTTQVADTLTQIITHMPPDALIPHVPATYPLGKSGTKGSDPMRSERTQHRTTTDMIRRSAGDTALQWHNCLVTDLARDDKDRVALTQLMAPVGQQTIRSFFEKTLTHLRADPSHLHHALTNWRRIPNYTGEYLDHRVIRSAADHPQGESSEIGVPGATWLAIMALPTLRLTGDGTTTTSTLWRRPPGQPPTMIWPLWHQPLDLASTLVLIEHPAININGHHETKPIVDPTPWPALGIFTIAAARRQQIEDRKSAGVLVPIPITTGP